MPANLTPIFPLTPKVSWGKVLTADATATKNHDGTSETAILLYTAGTFGSRIDEIRATSLGTNVATCLRIFINNGSDPTVDTNNVLYKELTVAATTISEVAMLSENILLSNSGLTLPAGYRLYGVVGTTIATGLMVSVVGGDY